VLSQLLLALKTGPGAQPSQEPQVLQPLVYPQQTPTAHSNVHLTPRPCWTPLHCALPSQPGKGRGRGAQGGSCEQGLACPEWVGLLGSLTSALGPRGTPWSCR